MLHIRLTALLGAISAIATTLVLAAPAHAVAVPGQGTWQSTLQPRDINGDGTVDAFYDTALNITWLANANAGAASSFDNGFSTTDGAMTWANAKNWAASLNVYGNTGWRLPTMIDTGASGCDFSNAGGTDCGYNVQTKSGATVYSEIAHLYYVALGNKAYCKPGSASCVEQPGWGLTNTGGFSNLQDFGYWSGVPYAPSHLVDAWLFYTGYGLQGVGGQSDELFALAVRPGDVTGAVLRVPEPQTLAMVLLALGAVTVVRRRAL